VTVAGKLNLFFIVLMISVTCALTGLVAQREYQVALDDQAERAVAQVLSRPDLQLYVYQRDEVELQLVLGGLLKSPTVILALAHDSGGGELARRSRANLPTQNLPPFDALRTNASATQTSLVALDSRQNSIGAGFWTSLFGEKSLIHLTIPVFSSVDPTVKGLTALDFYRAIESADELASVVVIGYVQLGIDRGEVLNSIRPTVGKMLGLSLALLLVCAAVVVLMTRRITKPMAQLTQLADEVASGEMTTRVEIRGGKEFTDIANALRGVVGNASNYKKEIEVDHKLLAMRADEGASELSRRSEELDQAALEITATKTQLQKMAYYDNLTSLPNRRLFTEQLGMLLRLSQRSGKTLALLFLNLDNFKRINESLGHSAGDLLLRETGKRLAQCLRDSDMLAHYVESEQGIEVSRLGGDEFTVVLNQLDDTESAGLVARRLIDRMLQPMTIEGQELVVSPSIGISLAPKDAQDVEGLLKAANTAMHHAKASPAEDFLFYNTAMDAATLDHLKLETDLRKAIEREQLLLHYQPQVDTVTGTVVGAEALLRWEHPEFGLVPPFKFITIAEEIGMMAELGDWVLVEVCRQMSEFMAQNLKLPRVAINISAFQFSPAFVARVKAVLLEAAIPAPMLELGLTEGMLMGNDSLTTECLLELREMGVYLSVDDFGTGCAPLEYLSHYPLDELKIDRSFVHNCDLREDSGRLVSAIIAMASALKLNTVAEGVETEGQLQFLSNNGARIMQGFLLSEPVPAGQLAGLLVPWHFMEQVQKITE
jgi:diguanylate cyclase (GGDEF)-like protein